MSNRISRSIGWPRFLIAALVVVTAVVSVIAIANHDSPRAHADARCDALRAKYGAGWPCVSVPTYTPPTTPPAVTTAPGATDNSGSGVNMHVDAGPGPGIGNGTPIVPVPGQPAPAPIQPIAPTGAATKVPSPGSPTAVDQQQAQQLSMWGCINNPMKCIGKITPAKDFSFNLNHENSEPSWSGRRPGSSHRGDRGDGLTVLPLVVDRGAVSDR